MAGSLRSEWDDPLFLISTGVFISLLLFVIISAITPISVTYPFIGDVVVNFPIEIGTLVTAIVSSLLAMLYSQQRILLQRQLSAEYNAELRLIDTHWSNDGLLLHIENIGNGLAKNLQCILIPTRSPDSGRFEDCKPLLYEPITSQTGETVELGPRSTGLVRADTKLPPFRELGNKDEGSEIPSIEVRDQQKSGGYLDPKEETTFWTKKNGINIAMSGADTQGLDIKQTTNKLHSVGFKSGIGVFLYLIYRDELGNVSSEFLSCNPNINLSDPPEWYRAALSIGPQVNPTHLEKIAREYPNEDTFSGKRVIEHMIAKEGY